MSVLVLDDSTLDKFYAKAIEPVHRHWSGKHKSVVRGINLVSLVWTDGDRILPTDYRVYDKPKDGLTKNDHFLAMLDAAKDRGFRPHAVLFDSWYSGLENLKRVHAHGWSFLTQLKVNRLVDHDRGGYRAVGVLPIAAAGAVVHLKGFGPIRVFKAVSRDGDVEHWATNDLAMDELRRLELAERCWSIEEYHRALKQCCNVERCQANLAGAAQPHRDGDPGVRAAVLAFLHHWRQLVRDEDWHRTRSDPGLQIATSIQTGTNCVAPMSSGCLRAERSGSSSPRSRRRATGVIASPRSDPSSCREMTLND